MTAVRTIIDKEWAEFFKNRWALAALACITCISTAIPLLVLRFASGFTPAAIPPWFQTVCTGIQPNVCSQAYTVTIFLALFMVMPVFIPTTIAAYSIVGEKTARTLEPLLATPVTTEELLVGKSLAAVIPGVAATWLSFGLFVLAIPAAGADPALRAYVLGPTWLLAILVLSPLMAAAAVNLAIVVSSWASEPRIAEQVSVILVLPLLAAATAQIISSVLIRPSLGLVLTAVLVPADIALILLAARLFQRETILTRWK